jgi:hypothetical protein
MQVVIEFIVPKFIESSTFFERQTAHHQEFQTLFAASGLYSHVLHKWIYKPDSANTVWKS